MIQSSGVRRSFFISQRFTVRAVDAAGLAAVPRLATDLSHGEVNEDLRRRAERKGQTRLSVSLWLCYAFIPRCFFLSGRRECVTCSNRNNSRLFFPPFSIRPSLTNPNCDSYIKYMKMKSYIRGKLLVFGVGLGFGLLEQPEAMFLRLADFFSGFIVVHSVAIVFLDHQGRCAGYFRNREVRQHVIRFGFSGNRYYSNLSNKIPSKKSAPISQ